LPTRVLYVLMTDLSRNNGSVGHGRSLVADLMACGADVTVIGFAPQDQQPRMDCEVIAIRGNVAVSMLRAVTEVLFAVIRRRPDLVVLSSFGNPVNPVIAAMLRSLGIRVAYDAQDPPVDMAFLLLRGSVQERLVAWFIAATDWIVALCVSDALTVSDGVARLLRNRGWRARMLPFLNIHSAIRPRVRPAQEESLRTRLGWVDSTIVMYVGSLGLGIRGIELQMQAIAKARKAGSDARLILLGPGAASEFRAMAEELGISDAVWISPPVPHAAMQGILAEVDYAVISSVPYAMPSKLFDYLAAGVHILCDATMEDVIRLCGEFVTKFDGTAEGLAQLLSLPRHRNDPTAIAPFLEGLQERNLSSTRLLIEAAQKPQSR
jgi:glycosyltransferase involved in cell wall biosynthesis